MILFYFYILKVFEERYDDRRKEKVFQLWVKIVINFQTIVAFLLYLLTNYVKNNCYN